MYGIDGTQNAAHGSDSPESAKRELGLFFDQFATKNTPNFDSKESTCLVIKPHVLVEGSLGQVLNKLQESIQGQANLEIIEMKTIVVNKQCAEEFLEVYKVLLMMRTWTEINVLLFTLTWSNLYIDLQHAY